MSHHPTNIGYSVIVLGSPASDLSAALRVIAWVSGTRVEPYWRLAFCAHQAMPPWPTLGALPHVFTNYATLTWFELCLNDLIFGVVRKEPLRKGEHLLPDLVTSPTGCDPTIPPANLHFFW